MYKLSNFTTSNTSKQANSEDFITLLRKRWDVVHEKPGVFRYKISNALVERILNSKYLIQLNTDRGTNRRMPEQINNLHQHFDDSKFNFTKVAKDEILFILEDDNKEIHSVLVNVSPISPYHSLLCPFVDKKLPQIVTEQSLSIALGVMFVSSHRSLRIAFNSLCAMASVNHLHYHLMIENNSLPAETVKCKHIKGPLYYFDDYPAPGFCIEVLSPDEKDNKCRDIYKLIKYLLSNNIAHNIFMTRGDGLDCPKDVIRVMVWPRKSSAGVKQFTTFNVAALELSGWVTLYNEEDYEKLQLEDLEKELKKWSIDNFDDLRNNVQSLF